MPGLLVAGLLAVITMAWSGAAHAQANNCSGPVGNPCIQITSVDNYSLGTWVGVGDLSLTQRHCVRVSGSKATAGLTYNVAFTSVGAAGGNLRFTSGPAATLQYQVTYANANGSNATTVTANGGTATGFSGITSTQQTICDTNDSLLGQRLTVTVTATQLNSAPPGAYSGTLQITVTPQ